MNLAETSFNPDRTPALDRRASTAAGRSSQDGFFQQQRWLTPALVPGHARSDPPRLCSVPVAQIPGVKLEETRSLQPQRDASTPQIVLLLQIPLPSTKHF